MYSEIFAETDGPSEITTAVHIFVLGGPGFNYQIQCVNNSLKKKLCLASLGIIKRLCQFVETRFTGLSILRLAWSQTL